MATIVVGPGSFMRPYRNVKIEHYPQSDAETFKLGAILVLDTAADKGTKVEEAAADPVAGIVGLAAEAAPGTEDAGVSVWKADEEGEFVGHVQDAMALDNDFIGLSRGVVYDATNTIWRVDTSESGSPCVKITRLVDAVADVNGRVAFKFLNSARSPYAS